MASSAARPSKVASPLAPEQFQQTPANAPLDEGVDRSGLDLHNFLRPDVQGRSFLKLLRNEATIVSEAAALLSRSASAGAPADAIVGFLPLKNRLRGLGHGLDTGLRETLFVPLTHEDIRGISAALIAVLESIVNVAALPWALRVLTETQLREASECCARVILSAVATLPRGKGMRMHTTELAGRARKAEFLLRDFELERAAAERDPIRLLKRKDAIVAIRAMFRRYREIANTFEYAVLKNG